jgi:Zn-dependent peptidase ImmA (M78 family)
MYDDDNNPSIKVARELARNLIKKTKLSTPPVILRDVIRLIPDIHVDSAPLEDEISGMYATDGKTDYIRYNENHHIHRNRFTVSHELGHALLGHNKPCKKSNMESKDPHEVEANVFATELLMPLTLLKKSVEYNTSASQLAYQFWVSKEALNWRLVNTGLFKKMTSWD